MTDTPTPSLTPQDQSTQPVPPNPVAPTSPDPTTLPPTANDAAAPASPVAPVGRRQKEIGPMLTAPQVESTSGSSEVATQTVEQAGGAPVEVEPAKELEPEIEKMVEKIKDQKVKPPEETVIAADTKPETVPKTVAQPVVVLPLSEQGMKKGRSKNTQHSVRWLYEWCVRQIRKLREFLVVYREE